MLSLQPLYWQYVLLTIWISFTTSPLPLFPFSPPPLLVVCLLSSLVFFDVLEDIVEPHPSTAGQGASVVLATALVAVVVLRVQVELQVVAQQRMSISSCSLSPLSPLALSSPPFPLLCSSLFPRCYRRFGSLSMISGDGPTVYVYLLSIYSCSLFPSRSLFSAPLCSFAATVVQAAKP